MTGEDNAKKPDMNFRVCDVRMKPGAQVDADKLKQAVAAFAAELDSEEEATGETSR